MNGHSPTSGKFTFASTIVTEKAPLAVIADRKKSSRSLDKVAKERNLKGKIRVVRSGCLDVCAFGPNMMIWPEGLWYMKVAKSDVPQIVDSYLKLEESDQAKTAGAAAK